MTTPERLLVKVPSTHALTFDDWLHVLDALETDATAVQREAAQDAIQRRAPLVWLEAVEARDSR